MATSLNGFSVRSLIPRASREAAHCHAYFSGPTVPEFRSRIRNISASGMLIDCHAPLHRGDVLIALLPGIGETLCSVARLRNGVAGVRFETPISLTQFRAAVAEGRQAITQG
ncbi:PilZ domain-containing protein [Sphingobium algorifonticola]|uniref:PilZ domain-containing protein n=1 Tax=Sphingobium algorifonticola TaxID=2008318 RepID=A0A437J4A4_9SPHN|nr:PilZ domain-containing protein [Sphingobium algorifonticola]RVT39459.1 hypothetical protein ENE74_15575 [Sphingobium algorifonticola]